MDLLESFVLDVELDDVGLGGMEGQFVFMSDFTCANPGYQQDAQAVFSNATHDEEVWQGRYERHDAKNGQLERSNATGQVLKSQGRVMRRTDRRGFI